MYASAFKSRPSVTVRQIIGDNHNWDAFQLANKDTILDVEVDEVNKMLSCKDKNRGFFTHHCEHCNTYFPVYFGCNSRICSNCGKNHTDKWAKSLSKALFNVPHRHAVLTIPDVLWSIVRENRFLLKVLMDSAIIAINNTRRIARYVARYIRHPAIANTRLHKYDGKTVTFWYSVEGLVCANGGGGGCEWFCKVIAIYLYLA